MWLSGVVSTLISDVKKRNIFFSKREEDLLTSFLWEEIKHYESVVTSELIEFPNSGDIVGLC